MPSLQIQDAFQPYYAELPAGGEKKRQELPQPAPGLSPAEVKARLETCRRRLALALAANRPAGR